MFGFGNSKSIPPKDGMQVFVRTNMGEQVRVTVYPEWTVGKIKYDLSNRLRSDVKDLRIIFAGKELPDDLLINQCDLGNNSILHAVRILTNNDMAEQENSKEEHLTPAKEKHPPEQLSGNLSGVIDLPKSSMNTLDPKPPEEPTKDHRNQQPQPTLLSDASTVMTIQLTEREIAQIQQLKAAEAATADQLRPHFYVYCIRPCASVKIGKLRVRCCECKEGALTLHKDPCSWPDVLKQNQIPATCESPGCGTTFAQFYFKCSGHETSGADDTAVPLYLVRTNLPGVPCLACMDVSSPIIVFECPSAHVMCLDCFVTYCISRLNERQFVLHHDIGYTLPCPTGCQNSLIEEVHHFKLMGEQQYERYQRFGAEEAVLSAGGVLCPHPGCGQGILPDEECRRVTCISGCGYVFCKDCLQGYHIGECRPEETPYANPSSCKSSSFDPQRAAQSTWDEASNLAIRILTKPCPKCRTATERDGGCMHMVCTRASCQFHWCWVCQTEWTRECMAAHWFG